MDQQEIYDRIGKEKDFMGICPECGNEDYGNHTVMNDVDKVFQVPLMLSRLNIRYHGYILECDRCGVWYEENYGKIEEKEKVQCNEIYNKKDCYA